MKKTSIIMLTFLLVTVFMNVGNISVEAKSDYLLKLSTQLNESDPLVDGFKEFKKNVEERTDGNLLIEIYPSAQLGSDEDVIEQTRMGVNVALLTDGGRMANYVKDIGVIGMPYIVDNYDEILDLVNTQSFKEWEEELANNHGLQVLAFNWYHGPRHFLTNEPVRKPEDLNGVRVRTPGAPVWQESIKAMGATPVALGWTEVYTAMQQDVIDGAEAQHLASYNSRLYEVINYINKTSHFQLINGIVVGDKWFNSLPEEYQNIVLEEAKKAGENTARKVIKLADDYEDRMVEEGMKVIDSDTEAFKNAAQQAYEELEFVELKEKLYEEMNK
ncbi:C4-dicarboxylate TRAP transporter substrate-binding protein [Halanaerobium sp.]|jgi:tripartite ATP-independent transporter DctP family solute receptor|uniref:C4-dicarboxylate TRAP transporter substrate-binding protein n=1 Tax=Halanaerobium sp. TaxID=1895664 RepID=UPI000DE6462E|nr:C4-dicarboxylate TRAP transporter substrate-binding protein [Halanaerobium sp.]PUU89310.1 MAG: TRAP-type C4-dicarboxylate transport system, periplasmic component [Halanaerobium sp.]